MFRFFFFYKEQAARGRGHSTFDIRTPFRPPHPPPRGLAGVWQKWRRRQDSFVRWILFRFFFFYIPRAARGRGAGAAAGDPTDCLVDVPYTPGMHRWRQERRSKLFVVRTLPTILPTGAHEEAYTICC
jgi:hypothetical protein